MDTGISVQVGIPWRPKATRLAAFEMVTAWYRDHEFEVIADEDPRRLGSTFNLAAARNHLVRKRMTSDVMVLSDADTFPEIEPLQEAIEAAALDNLVHLPYHLYVNDLGEFTLGATSGIFVFTRAAWESTHGQDERFEGWGFEDSAWRLAHLTLNGPIPRHRGTAHAFSHPPAPRDRVPINHRRYKLYAAAYGNPTAMKRLVHGGNDVETAPIGHQVRTATIRVKNAERAAARRSRPLGS